jgi:hypothetical protein
VELIGVAICSFFIVMFCTVLFQEFPPIIQLAFSDIVLRLGDIDAA